MASILPGATVNGDDPGFIPDQGAGYLGDHIRILCNAVDRRGYEIGISDYARDRSANVGGVAE